MLCLASACHPQCIHRSCPRLPSAGQDTCRPSLTHLAIHSASGIAVARRWRGRAGTGGGGEAVIADASAPDPKKSEFGEPLAIEEDEVVIDEVA